MSKVQIRRSRSAIKYVEEDTSAIKLQDEITCKGCFKEFSSNRIPKILHCLHNLCSECINMSFVLNPEKNTVMCPTCKINCVGKSADTFRTHSYVQIISDVVACYRDQMNETLKCIGCSNVASLRCLSCNENYCQEHTGIMNNFDLSFPHFNLQMIPINNFLTIRKCFVAIQCVHS